MITINSSTRQFNIPGADLVFGVESDSGSVVKEFQCPRYVGNNLDLTGCFIRMNYRNANGEIDFKLIENVTVDGDNVVFGWELSPKVTMYKGNVSFVMCVVGPDNKLKWHTTLGRGQVLEGLEPDNEWIESVTGDGIAELIAMVEAQTKVVEDKGAEWVRNVQSEGTDQITAVQTAARNAQSDAVAEIEAKGVNVRESIPDDYTALSEAVDTLNRTRGAAIVCEAAGEAVVVNDSSDLPMQGLRVFGKTTQVKTTGAQLLDFSAMNMDSGGTTKANIKNSGKSVAIVGTKAYAMGYIDVDVSALSGKTVYLSGEKSGGNNPSITVRLIKADGTKTYITTATTGYTILEDDATIQIQFIANNTATALSTATTATFDNVILSVTQGAAWEPYSDGVASPSPEYPQELVSLEPVISVCGKNLFDGKLEIGAINANSGTLYYIENESRMVNYIPVTPGVPIYIKREDTEGAIKPRFYDRDYNYLGTGTGNLKLISGYSDANPMNDGTGECCISIINEAVSYMKICVASVNLENHYMVSVVNAEYEESPGNQTLPLTHTLPGIPVTSGGNYTDSDGQQWICDEVDLERGVYVQRIGVTDLTEADWTQNSSGKYFSGKNRGMYSTAYRVLCTHINGGTASDGNKENVIFINANRDIRLNITLDDNTIETVTSTMNGAVLVGVLNTPVETALSETEIAAYRAMHSNYPNTTVLNDSGAHMVVKYAADTKLYIDNKIAALIGG